MTNQPESSSDDDFSEDEFAEFRELFNKGRNGQPYDRPRLRYLARKLRAQLDEQTKPETL